jgi:fructosamine-3-kinase
MNKALIQHLGEGTGTRVTKIEQVFGGDINETYVLYAPGKKLFVKLNTADKCDMFEKEFAGLELLRTSGTIAVPEPLKQGKFENRAYLVMECLEKGSVRPGSWQTFGQQLAALHKNTSACFGLDHDNYIGSLPQPNKHCSTWTEFYAEQRILFFIRMAFDDKKCDGSDARMAERLCSRLDALFPAGQPALLHGDLWSGNFMINQQGKPAIYDPAVYYGHREMDIGMTLLFGGFDKSFYSYYNETWPLEKDWEKRVDLTQLYPLLVHLNLFGGHYYQQVRETLKKYR